MSDTPIDCLVLAAIKAAALVHRKAGIKDKSFEAQCRSTIFSTLIGAITTKAKDEKKEPDDAMCISSVQKFLDGIEDVLKYQPRGDTLIKAQIEKAELLPFVPQKMNEKELEDSIVDIMRELGDKLNEKPGPKANLMKELKARYAGKYDGSLANTLITKILS